MQHHVTIGPEFFAKAKNDYQNWRWAIAREFMQNSMDCGADEIHVSVELDGGDTRLRVTNNGEPMTRDILVGKLLSLGGSGKNFTGPNGEKFVGGFGKAKEILYFCHSQYHIESGSLVVNGRGASYDLHEGEFRNGTSSTIVIAGDEVQKLSDAFRRFCSYAQWHGKVWLNGDLLETSLRKGSPRRSLSFGQIYTNKSFSNRVIVRINGVPMFWDWTSLDRCVILELAGTSADVLTANRDGLKGAYARELTEFITDLAVDKRKALSDRQPKYRHLSGVRLKHRVQRAVNAPELVASVSELVTKGTPNPPKERVAALQAPVATFEPRLDLVPIGEVTSSFADLEARTQTLSERPCSTLSEEFVIKNETDLKVPDYYLPDSDQFCSYAKKLARIWGRLLLELHRLFEHEAEFAIGFLFDEESEAEYEEGAYGRVYYVNPAVVVKQKASASKSFKKRFQLTERNRLLMLALHEFVHGLGIHRHDEDYANKLTAMAWRVMDERKRFNWCF